MRLAHHADQRQRAALTGCVYNLCTRYLFHSIPDLKTIVNSIETNFIRHEVLNFEFSKLQQRVVIRISNMSNRPHKRRPTFVLLNASEEPSLHMKEGMLTTVSLLCVFANMRDVCIWCEAAGLAARAAATAAF